MAKNKIELIEGPPVSKMSHEAALSSIQHYASQMFPADAEVDVHSFRGHWVASIVTANPFGGPPADDSEEAPGPKSEGPDDTAPDGGGDGPPSDDGGSDGPPSGDGDSDGGDDKHKKDKKGGELAELKADLAAIAAALGVQLPSAMGDPMGGDPLGGGDPMGGPPVPGATPPPPPGAGGPPPGMGASPTHGGAQVVQHQKSLKPGEVPPGATPAGAPAFSSVRPDHPWVEIVGKKASFHVASPVTDLVAAERELHSLAAEVNHRVASFTPGTDAQGNAVATAVITAH